MRPRSKARAGVAHPSALQRNRWTIPYVDQPVDFWHALYADFAAEIAEVYFPISASLLGSGRPELPGVHREAFLRGCRLPKSVLVNAALLPAPVGEVAPPIIEELRRLDGEYGLSSATVASLQLAERIRDALPDFSLTASVLMDIADPNQALMVDGVCDVLVPGARAMRNLSRLRALGKAFSGRIRLLVNEACLIGCPYRLQHFFEMGSGVEEPLSLCDGLLERQPWLRLTGAWVLPQHLHLYDGHYHELKLAGRATLQDPDKYLRVLTAYVRREPLLPNEIGGGPASVLEPIEIPEELFAFTLECGHRCHECNRCEEHYARATTAGRIEDAP